MNDSTAFACDMSALSPAQRTEHAQLARALFGAVVCIRPCDDSYAFVLRDSDEALALAGRFIALERRCCPFFTFTLSAAPDAATELVIGGPAGVEPFIQAELGAYLPGGVRFTDGLLEAR